MLASAVQCFVEVRDLMYSTILSASSSLSLESFTTCTYRYVSNANETINATTIMIAALYMFSTLSSMYRLWWELFELVSADSSSYYVDRSQGEEVVLQFED